MKLSKKRIAAFAAAALAAVVLAGCGNNADNTGAAGSPAASIENSSAGTGEEADVNDDGTVNNPEKVVVDAGKLVFWSMFGGGDGEYMDQMIADYNGTQPASQVQSIMLVWADYYTKLQTAVAAGKGPDIGVSHASSLAQLVEDGVVEPITPYLDELGIDLNEHYSKASVDAVTFDGEVYAIPLDTHAEILTFNKTILEQAGIELNAAGQVDINSADDFFAVCDQIKAVLPDGGSTISIVNSNDEPYRVWWAIYFQMGGTPLVNEAGTEVTLNKEIAVRAAEFVKEWYDRGYVLEGIDDHQKFFQSGKAGICVNGTWSTGAYEGTENLEFVPVPFPQMFDNKSCWADSHTFILPVKKTRSDADSKAAVEFMLYAAMDGGVTWAGSGQIPACKDVLETEAYLSLPFRSSYMEEVDYAVLPTKVSTFNGMKTGMIDSLNLLWSGKADAVTAIDSLYDELESNLP